MRHESALIRIGVAAHLLVRDPQATSEVGVHGQRIVSG